MEEEFKMLELDMLWEKHFKELGKTTRRHSFDIGDSTYNKPLNRYQDILPYNRSRIKLIRSPDNDYINANLVTVPKAARQYILTQGPLPNTVGHFWLMIWEQKSTVIVMLNKCLELENFVKCEQYWPGSVGSKFDYPDVKLTVTLTSVDEEKHFTVRSILLEDKESNKSRQISQFQYKAWPDYGQPNSPTSFLRLLTEIRKSGGLDKMDEPTVVHCSAGVGRSGTFCLIDSVLSMVENQGSTEGIEISSTLIDMRDYRMGLIQTPVQLRFAYMTIIYGIKILEQANKLHFHMSSMTAVDKSNQQKSTNGSSAPNNGKKQRRNRKKPSSSIKSSSLNVFNKHLLVEAMDDIESDDADKLFDDSMKHFPSLKKARNSEPDGINLEFLEKLKQLTNDDLIQQSNEADENDQQMAATTKAQLLTNAINLLAESKISQNVDLSPNSAGRNTDSVLLRRMERELRNQRLAEKTLDIKNRMKAEELKKERYATKLAFLKKSLVVGGMAILLGSIAYMYNQGH